MIGSRFRTRRHPADPLTCRELVHLVTDYLEGALSDADVRRFDAHLAMCDGCETYLAQIRETIRLTGTLTEEHLDPHARDELLHAFRAWKRER